MVNQGEFTWDGKRIEEIRKQSNKDMEDVEEGKQRGSAEDWVETDRWWD